MFKRLSIQSKLILMLLLVAVTSIATVGWVSYSSGEDALRTAALNQLISVRASKKVQIEAFFKTIRNQVSNLADDRMMISALREMTVGFNKFKGTEIKPEWDARLQAFYREDFLPKLAKGTGQTPRFEAFFPTTPEARFAQYLYIASNPNPPVERFELNDARDGSDYSAAHARYHPIFSKFVQDFRYDNLILIDQAGDVVYTFTKSPLFATNLLDGPYSEGNAAALFKSLRRSTNLGEVRVEDFAHTPSAAGKPVGFMGAAVLDGSTQIGVMILQIPVDEINRVMTDNFGWIQDGLGKTGEVYLVGSDRLMRSRSRLLHEDPELFFKQLTRAGYSADDIATVRRFGTATLAQPVRTQSVESALAGKTDIIVNRNYRGVNALTAYAPLYVLGLRWVIVAQIESSEAFAPLTDLTRRIVLSSAIMILIVTALAAYMSRRFVRPIVRLVEGAHRLEAGDRGVNVDVETRDEFADLGASFNHMSKTLTERNELLDIRTRERDELLDNLLPPAAAARMKKGQPPVVDEYLEISVLYANLLPVDESHWSKDAETSLDISLALVAAIDDAAEARGVEKSGCTGATYIACCGISAERADHASRMLLFAEDILTVARRLHRDRRAKIRVQIGIDSGPAAGGVAGRARLSYYLSGETVSIAAILASQCPPGEILVARQTYTYTQKLFNFGAPVRVIPPQGGSPVTAWPLKPAETKSAVSSPSSPPSGETLGVSHA